MCTFCSSWKSLHVFNVCYLLANHYSSQQFAFKSSPHKELCPTLLRVEQTCKQAECTYKNTIVEHHKMLPVFKRKHSPADLKRPPLISVGLISHLHLPIPVSFAMSFSVSQSLPSFSASLCLLLGTLSVIAVLRLGRLFRAAHWRH